MPSRKQVIGGAVLAVYGGLLVVALVLAVALRRDVRAISSDPVRQWAMACVSKAQSNEPDGLHKQPANKRGLTDRGE